MLFSILLCGGICAVSGCAAFSSRIVGDGYFQGVRCDYNEMFHPATFDPQCRINPAFAAIDMPLSFIGDILFVPNDTYYSCEKSGKPRPRLIAVAAPASKTTIENDIKKLVAVFSDGFTTSCPQYWHIEFCKIFGGSNEDAVAIFSVEGFDGGNDDHQYLAFFEAIDINPEMSGQNRPFRLVAVTQIGGRGWREFDNQLIKQIGNDFITLNGRKYGAGDAMCCPSVPIRVTFRIKNGIISESK